MRTCDNKECRIGQKYRSRRKKGYKSRVYPVLEAESTQAGQIGDMHHMESRNDPLFPQVVAPASKTKSYTP